MTNCSRVVADIMGKLKKGFRFIKEQKGISLVETVIVLGLLGLIGAAFAAALWTISSNTGIYDERLTASSLVQSQAEEIKALNYDTAGNYPLSVATPPGYIVSISAVEVQTGKQEITIAVSHGGQPVFKLKTIKTDW